MIWVLDTLYNVRYNINRDEKKRGAAPTEQKDFMMNADMKRAMAVLELSKIEATLKQLEQMFAVTKEEAEAMAQLSKMADALSRKIAVAREMA